MNRLQLFISLSIHAIVGILVRIYNPYLKFTELKNGNLLILGLFIIGLIILLFLKLRNGDYLPIWKIFVIILTVVTIFYWVTYFVIK